MKALERTPVTVLDILNQTHHEKHDDDGLHV
jgi:hypothetical protein